MGFAEAVTTRNQRNRLFIVHRHAAEGLANVSRRGNRVRLAVRPFRIHIDEAHLHGAQRIGELTLTGIARVVAQPGLLGAP